MIKAIISDFSRVLLFTADSTYQGELNSLFDSLSKNKTNFNFWDFYKLNYDLYTFYSSLKSRVKIFMFTAGLVQNVPELHQINSDTFETIFSASELSLNKSDPKSYLVLSQKINIAPENILFIDDSIINVNAARTAGLNAVKYVNNAETINEINNYL
jgi:FMN phosphatase YigB (HAD superfamily)